MQNLPQIELRPPRLLGEPSGTLVAGVLVCLMVVTALPAWSQEGSGAGLLAAAEQAVTAAVERAAPSVVAVARVRKDGRRDVASELELPVPGILRPGTWGGNDLIPTEFGSGVIISEDGDILTCYHVIDDPELNEYYVWYVPASAQGGGKAVRVPAEVQAGDPWTDLAVLKIKVNGLPVMPMGDAAELKRGSFVVSLGNPYATANDGRASASFGIVSNLQRRAPTAKRGSTDLGMSETLSEFGTLIQTDAKLNLGTSGGALVDLKGRMVGLTTSLAAVSGFEQGAGYAIPIDGPTLATVAQLQEGRAPAFGFLGVEPVTAIGVAGALVQSVVPGLAAEKAGLRSGDLIVSVEGQAIEGAEGLFREMSRRPADAEVKMTVVPSGISERREVLVRLGKKRLALSRPGYSRVEEPSWRGMTVDFASALPPDRLMRGDLGGRGEAAVVRVDPGSPAWNAGVRPGRLVLAVEATPVRRPGDFLEAIKNATGVVELTLAGQFGGSERVDVQAQEE